MWDRSRKVLIMVLRVQFLCVVVVMAVIVAVVIVVNTWGRRCDVRGFSPGSIVRSEADFLL